VETEQRGDGEARRKVGLRHGETESEKRDLFLVQRLEEDGIAVS
jgi:hypothetical protein